MTQIVDLAKHSERHVTVAELAAYWRVSERTVYHQIAKGALPATRVGRGLRIRTQDALRFGRIDEVVTAPIASV